MGIILQIADFIKNAEIIILKFHSVNVLKKKVKYFNTD